MREIVYTVTEISEYIKKLLEEDPYLVNVSVYGEITNVRPRKGHIFSRWSMKTQNWIVSCSVGTTWESVFKKERWLSSMAA